VFPKTEIRKNGILWSGLRSSTLAQSANDFTAGHVDPHAVLAVTEGTLDIGVRVEPTGDQDDVRVRVDPRETHSYPKKISMRGRTVS